ncbi:MAG TPA: class I SAM-dependent methyltransferase [Smithella sp.]|nr:class I SAM-dependent methyltransferase [Smithella sp.]
MLETVLCNLCGGFETEKLFEINENITGRSETFNMVRCKACGLCFINPRPVRDTIALYYPEDSYYSYQFRNPASPKQRIKNYILEEQAGYAHSGTDGILVRITSQLIKRFMKNQILMSIPYRPGGKALDIGCGCGEHLLWLKNHGWSAVHGVELSSRAARLANEHGLNVFCGELAAAGYPENYFDFITLGHVLEHMHDPMMTLKEIHRVLKDDGVLVIGVPNFESFENRIFGKDHSFLEAPRHLYHFSIKTMNALLEKNGLRVDKTVGKTFFIPKASRSSFKALLKNGSTASFISALYKIYIQRPFMYMLSTDKECFGQLFTFYVKKK